MYVNMYIYVCVCVRARARVCDVRVCCAHLAGACTERRRTHSLAAWRFFMLAFSKKPTRVAAPSPRASLGLRTVCARTVQRRPPVSKHYETKVNMVYGSFLLAAAALKTPTRNGYKAQGVNLTFR